MLALQSGFVVATCTYQEMTDTRCMAKLCGYYKHTCDRSLGKPDVGPPVSIRTPQTSRNQHGNRIAC